MKLINSTLFTALILLPTITLPADSPSVEEAITALGTSLNKQISSILKKNIPLLGYTGLACCAGTAGIVTSYNGFNRLCNGIEKDKRRSTFTGTAELSVGLGTTALSVATIYLLWKNH